MIEMSAPRRINYFQWLFYSRSVSTVQLNLKTSNPDRQKNPPNPESTVANT